MALTDTQLQTLATHIRANTDPDVVAALAIRNDTEMARLYNLPGTIEVWNTSVQPDEYRAVIDYAETEGIDVGKSTAFEWMTGGLREALDFSRAQVRAGVESVFPNTGPGASPITRAAIQALYARTSSVYEEVFITGPGPVDAVVLGPVNISIIGRALNNF